MDLMIDMETLDVSPSATILTIGAQGFSTITGELSGTSFYRRISLEGQENRTILESTLEWWSKQDKIIQEEAFSDENRVTLSDALSELSTIAWKHDRIWANGVLFDIGILENAFVEHNMQIPWKFWEIMDCRTILKLGNERHENNHNALEDCKSQIMAMSRVFKKFGIKRFG